MIGRILLFVLLCIPSIRSALSAVEVVSPIGGAPSYTCVGRTTSNTPAGNLSAFVATSTQFVINGYINYGSYSYTPGVLLDVYGGNTGDLGCRSVNGTFQYQSRIYIPASLTCPVPSSGSPYVFNPATGLCERQAAPVCPAAGTSFSSGWYDVGTDPLRDHPILSACTVTGCNVQYNGGNVSGSRIITGIKHYYAKGAYIHEGTTCTPLTANAVPGTFNALPGSTCAPGQSYIYMSGREKCFDSGTGQEANTASASAVEAAATKAALDALQQALNAASAVQAAKDAAAAAGGDASAVQQAGIAAAAQVASDQAKQEQTDPCKDSNSISCMETGDVPEADAIEERTIDFSTFTFNTYTFNGTASCPAPRVVTIHGELRSFSYQPFCDFLSVFKFAALAVAMFIAAMIMIGQRSSDSQG